MKVKADGLDDGLSWSSRYHASVRGAGTRDKPDEAPKLQPDNVGPHGLK